MQAQSYAVSGYVYDADTQERLGGATVYDQRSQRGVVANRYGFFSLSVEADSVVLAVSFLGYTPVTLPLRLDGDRAVRIELDPVPLGLGEVVVEDTGRPREVGTNAFVLTPREVEALPALLGEADLLRTMQLLPGIKGGLEGSTGLYVRGGSPDQNLILLDGGLVYNPAHLFGLISTFNPDVIQSVRMRTAGFPARYGGRLSSVIDVTTRDGDRSAFGGQVTVGLIGARLTLEGPLQRERSSFIASGRLATFDLLQWVVDPSSPEHYRFGDFNLKADHAVSEQSRLYLSLYGGSDRWSFKANSEDGPQRSAVDSGYGWTNQTATLRWTTAPSARFFLSALAAVSRYRYRLHDEETNTFAYERPAPGGGARDSTSFETDIVRYRSTVRNARLAVDAEYRLSRRQGLLAGLAVTHHTFQPGTGTFRSAATGTQPVDTTLAPSGTPHGWEGAAYVENELDLASRWAANIGLHLSAFHLGGRAYASAQPRLLLRFHPTAALALQASYATMRQYVHLLTHSGVSLPTDVWVPTRGAIRPQRARVVSLGATVAPADGRFEASAEVYAKTMRGLLEYREGADYLALEADWTQMVEQGRGTSRGLEVLVRKPTGRLSGWLSYAFTHTDRHFPVLNDGRPFPFRYDRRHDVAATGTFALRPKHRVAATWVYRTGDAMTLPVTRYQGAYGEEVAYSSRNGVRLPPYHRLDLSYAFTRPTRRGTATLTVGVYNAYSRLNVLYVTTDLENRVDPATGRPIGQQVVFKKRTYFPILPSISYRTSF